MSEIDFFIQIFETLKAQPVLTLFLILGTGYLIGNIRITGFSLGPVAGVLFAGLLLGHFGFLMSPNTQALGFALFIFSVGYQAGPHFFDVLKMDGLKYFSLAIVVACTGFGVVVVVARLLSLEPGVGAGLLAGGLTSSPTLALAGVVVTMITMVVAYFFGRKVLKLNPVLLLGAITGAMTSGAALSVVTREAKSSVPALGYTGAYAFSSVLLAIAGGLILLF